MELFSEYILELCIERAMAQVDCGGRHPLTRSGYAVPNEAGNVSCLWNKVVTRDISSRP